ncbi:MAG TPA: hypothetical protein ENK66_09230 [Arcobacter sp.]|nr:hypothetical protein [Arcobacter sp.]
MFKRLLERVDLHIVTLQAIMFLLLFVEINANAFQEIFLKSSDGEFGVKIICAVILFLFPQGIILTRELKRKGFKFYIGSMDYFIANELFTLFSIMVFLGIT